MPKFKIGANWVFVFSLLQIASCGDLMKGIYLKIYTLAKSYLATRDNDIHTRVCYPFAQRLCESEGGDERVVLPAIILHDVGWIRIPAELHTKAFGPGPRDTELNRVHETEGAKIAGEILADIEYDPGLIDEIVEIVLGHDSRESPLSRNDAIVKDADKLWRFSEIGFDVSVRRFKLDPSWFVVWLNDQVDGWFLTDTGRHIAIEEHALRARKWAKKKGEKQDE